ncbi:MAG: ABC transporter ATP-binding protein [Deltaproteobacteria bacterium]|nr:ABC transporter ATP-binding protein [Deltaproteobacteria bacterium]MBW1924163.1 ABC transporter ATP-binding protein [Deltaproteobacteria bacterium]MBW1949932.1 ABC transporter ATP-binding protein [Deltaproteobacteria bacterium]MBW2008463.1 ABC transporter ATP-binding protein [Deltaproteobacteria bacterium]MBW2102226.1 ABC transporter ATP-binding protein [Deltaproteobacteria bacterium]
MAFFEARDISISFGGLKALNRVSFQVEEGEVFSIIGPNGAGKTTIFNCINRYYTLDEGTFVFGGKDITRARPYAIAAKGIARTFQNIELFKNTTVLDNLLLGRHRHRKTSFLSEALFLPWVRKQELRNREKAEEVIDFLDLQAYRDQQVAGLPYGVQKTVELGRALATEPKLLLLDEPSSGMNMEEMEDLSYWITDIKEELGITILMVEHNMRLVRKVSDRVLAMDFGVVITQGETKEVLEHPDVLQAYLGEEGAATRS